MRPSASVGFWNVEGFSNFEKVSILVQMTEM